MDLTSPISSVIPSSRGRVLAVLASTTVGLTGRGVAELVGDVISRRAVSNALGELVRSGVILMESHPPANLYRLNREHVAAPAIGTLASLREELLNRMRAHLAAWEVPPEAGWLFGSLARGEGGLDSDIDVLLIRPDGGNPDDAQWIEQVDAFSDQVQRWTGNDCAVIEFSIDEFVRLEASGEQLIEDVVRDGIHLGGRPLPRRHRTPASR